MQFSNRTALESDRLLAMFTRAATGWPVHLLDVRVRYSRSSDFSGTCFYRPARILINLGRHLSYPYRMETYIGRTVSTRTTWWKPSYTVELADGYQVVLFVFLHECYHWLVKRAGRNTRQKESMCDRFATRHLVDHWGAVVRDKHGRIPPRGVWDFQDLDGFVAQAMVGHRRLARELRPAARQATGVLGAQLELFPLSSWQ